MSRLKYVVICTLVCASSLLVAAQRKQADEAVSNGIADFSLEFLSKTISAGGDHLNIILSSLSVWTLLAILNAGASGATSSQLTAALRIPLDENHFNAGLKQLTEELAKKTNGVELDIANAIFVDRTKQLIPRFMAYAADQYKVNFIPVDFRQEVPTARYIDAYVANITKDKIKHFINYDDLRNAEMLLTTAIYFKGNWNLPFNQTATFRTNFYDETLTRSLGQVMMMYQVGPYPFTKLSKLKGHVIELPYGEDEKYSMLVLLPMKNVLMNTFLQQLAATSFQSIFDDLDKAKKEYYGDDVQVLLPKFSISSDYIMNVILEQMGIYNIFTPVQADLRKISYDNVYLSRVIHKATIDVDEEGTVAAAVSGGTISYKSPPATFNASHPFVFFIVEVKTKTILFLGKYCNPNQE